MLKFFFNRQSPVVYLLNLMTTIEVLILFLPTKTKIIYFSIGWQTFFIIFSWIFLNIINWIPWYGKLPGKIGIRLHFQKNIIPTVYISTIALSLKLLGVNDVWLTPFAILFLPILYVSFILLYFHFKDDSKIMPSYFTHNFYLKDK